ncbi:CRAL/TRIO domain [Popillia japonica]|uniref:CRAL/TRIO domain n=1 Tax=Popillia japonica TaxID=7064 RepID=A0AAW1IV80_POPJA
MPAVADTMLSNLSVLPRIQCGDFTLELELGPLPPEIEEVARKELRETPENKKEGIEKLRELLKGETDLKCPYHSDTWLVRFLRPCKFHPESAHQLVKRYYAFKLKHNVFYDNLLPANEKNVFEQDILTVLPTRDQHKRRILVIELGKKWKHTKCSLDEVFKGCVLYLEAALLENLTQIGGVVVIFDMDGLSMQQTWQFTPPFAKRIVDWLQDSIPCRVKNIHIINQPYIFNIVFALFKPFLREKLKKRIIFHGTDRKSLHSYLTPSCLPKCYGGTMEIPRITGSQWLELLNMCEEEYRVINSFGYNKT